MRQDGTCVAGARPLRKILVAAAARAVVIHGLLVSARFAGALDLWSARDNDGRAGIDLAAKVTGLASHAPDDPVLYPERDSQVGLFRFRMTGTAAVGDGLNAELAYEHRLRRTSKDAGAGTGSRILPSATEAPYRIVSLDWQITEEDDGTYSHFHEIDRALLAMHPSWGEVILGRQAIGLGRGTLFSVVDLFAPFSPTEVDREWRRGVDAIRAEYRLSDTTSAEVIGVFDEAWEDSASVGRLRGYLGDVDGEILLGKRARDGIYAGILSAAVGDAEVHAELAIFHTPEEQPDPGLFNSTRLVEKGVLGSSYTFDVGDGLTVLGEYHYSGFGVDDVEDLGERLADSDYQGRLLRGDVQALGKHALAMQCSVPIGAEWGLSLVGVSNPIDGSGILTPSVTWDAAENITVVGSGFVPWGRKSADGELRSEYGASPVSLFLQVSGYY